MNLSWPESYWQVGNVRYYLGNVTDVLRTFPSQSVQCAITSPPYWALRDYGTGTWEGGRAGCGHKAGAPRAGRPDNGLTGGKATVDAGTFYRGTCGKCGARRVDRQIGSEPSPDCNSHGQRQCKRCFVCTMVAVFREVRRVLRDDGVLWLNLGDTYVGSLFEKDRPDEPARLLPTREESSRLPSGNLVGIPWRVALALQADGWVLRDDVIWHKPSPMPSPDYRRCTRAHEYVFTFAKNMRYFYDTEAITEELAGKPHAPSNNKLDDSRNDHDEMDKVWGGSGRRIKRSVWTVASHGYPGAHYATFPPELIRPCVKAGTSQRGACAKCGSSWRRVVDATQLTRERPRDFVKRNGEEGTGNVCANSVAGVSVKTLGWEPTCSCDGHEPLGDPPKEPEQRRNETHDQFEERWQKWAVADETWRAAWARLKPVWDAVTTTPCVVLDPFIGSGTTAQVCIEEGRACVGIDLSEQYLTENAIPRVLPYLTPARLLPLPQGICKALQGVRSETRG